MSEIFKQETASDFSRVPPFPPTLKKFEWISEKEWELIAAAFNQGWRSAWDECIRYYEIGPTGH